ncbi:MAG: hypothetical protein AMXMBFR33_56240 [Candidatus Xenobia bacterium]
MSEIPPDITVKISWADIFPPKDPLASFRADVEAAKAEVYAAGLAVNQTREEMPNHPMLPVAENRRQKAEEALAQAEQRLQRQEQRLQSESAWAGYQTPDVSALEATIQGALADLAEVASQAEGTLAAWTEDWQVRRQAARENRRNESFPRPALSDGWAGILDHIGDLLRKGKALQQRAPHSWGKPEDRDPLDVLTEGGRISEDDLAIPRVRRAVQQAEEARAAWDSEQTKLFWQTKIRVRVPPPRYDYRAGCWVQTGPDGEPARREWADTGIQPGLSRERQVISISAKSSHRETWEPGTDRMSGRWGPA